MESALLEYGVLDYDVLDGQWTYHVHYIHYQKSE